MIFLASKKEPPAQNPSPTPPRKPKVQSTAPEGLTRMAKRVARGRGIRHGMERSPVGNRVGDSSKWKPVEKDALVKQVKPENPVNQVHIFLFKIKVSPRTMVVF